MIGNTEFAKEQTMKLNDFVVEVHEAARLMGWWDKPRSALEVQMLIVSEVAEATEEVRKSTPAAYVINHAGVPVELESLDFTSLVVIDNDQHRYLKPEGEMIELVDAMIRIMDYAGYRKWDLEAALRLKFEYNKTRSHRHGGKAY